MTFHRAFPSIARSNRCIHLLSSISCRLGQNDFSFPRIPCIPNEKNPVFQKEFPWFGIFSNFWCVHRSASEKAANEMYQTLTERPMTVWIERGVIAADWTLNVLCRITAGGHFVCDSIYVLLSRQSRQKEKHNTPDQCERFFLFVQ